MSASLHLPQALFHVRHTVVAVRKNQIGAKTLMSYMAVYQPQRLLITIISNNSCNFSMLLFHLRGDVIEIMGVPNMTRVVEVSMGIRCFIFKNLSYRDPTPYGDAIMRGLRPSGGIPF